MPSEPSNWINILDFSPGIRDKLQSPTQQPAGVADGAQTYDCITTPLGTLVPLPRLIETKTRNHTNILTPEDGSVRISGFHVTGPMQDNRYTTDYVGDDNVELHFAFEGVAADSTHKWIWERVRRWATDTAEIIKSLTVTHDVSWVKADQNYRPTSFVDHRLHPTDPTLLGNIFVVAGWSPDDMQATENIWLIFPDPDAQTTLSTYAIRSDAEPSILVSHQGRVVSLDRHVFQHGPAGFWVTNDQFIWTSVNLKDVDPPGAAPDDLLTIAVFSLGDISGYGAAGSSSAQELLAVKHRGGAITISGDMDQPTVYSLPGVVSTNGAMTYGLYTPLGFIYLVKDRGIYVWGGGDTSQKLSDQLSDSFAQIKPSDWRDYYGQFAVTKDWILTPNNYVFDTTTKSWWRISPSTPVLHWQSSPQNSIFYGAPVSFVSGGAIMYVWHYTSKVTTYRWQSLFLPQTIDREITVREITFRAQRSTGAGETVQITLIDSAGNTVSKSKTLDNVSYPKLYRISDLGFKCQGLKVRIDATATSTNPAPEVVELNIGYDTTHRLAHSN